MFMTCDNNLIIISDNNLIITSDNKLIIISDNLIIIISDNNQFIISDNNLFIVSDNILTYSHKFANLDWCFFIRFEDCSYEGAYFMNKGLPHFLMIF